MIRALDHNQLLRVGRRGDKSLQLRPRTKLIAAATDKQFRLHTAAQEIKRVGSRCFGIGSDWNRRNSDSDHGLYPRIRTRRSQPNRSAERESCKQKRQMELRIQPVEGGADIVDLAVAMIVLAGAESGAAKVEAQHGKSNTIQSLHGMEYNLVMERPAKHRMGMANYRRVRRTLGASVEQRFQPSRRAFQEERLDG